MGAATLGSVFEKYKLNAICHDCGRSKELDVAALKDKYGDDFEIPRSAGINTGSSVRYFALH